MALWLELMSKPLALNLELPRVAPLFFNLEDKVQVQSNESLHVSALPCHQFFKPTTMRIVRTIFNTAILGGAGTAGGWVFWTRNSKFVPLSSSDPIFTSSYYSRDNPNHNPATQDLCVRKVPLRKIQPQLLEEEGRLTEAFCAGVWGGFGM